MALPGVKSVIVPLPSVVVVVVVVSETCAQANGATAANAMLSSTFFMFSLPVLPYEQTHHTSAEAENGARSHYLFGLVDDGGCVSGKAKVSLHLAFQ